MEIVDFFETYHSLSADSRKMVNQLVQNKSYSKGEHLIRIGEIANSYYFLKKGLVAYYYISPEGDQVIKRFFTENSFVASTASIITQQPSIFAIEVLEDCEITVLPAHAFRELMLKNHDIAIFHINYLEKNWVVDKEPSEIFLKHETAKTRYIKWLDDNPTLLLRVKQHHIASALGITPTQLSRIRKELF